MYRNHFSGRSYVKSRTTCSIKPPRIAVAVAQVQQPRQWDLDFLLFLAPPLARGRVEVQVYVFGVGRQPEPD